MSEQEQKQGTARDAVEAAFDEVEPEFDEDAIAPTEEPEATPSPEADPTLPLETVGDAVPDSNTDEATPAPDAPPSTAPQSWGVAEREAWAGLDPSVQAQIHKREKEINEALSHSGQARQFHEQFGQMVQPYAGLIAAEGTTPMETVDAMLQTVAGLMTGTPGTKAQLVADAIKQYGVDINQLDSILAGEMPSEDPNAHVESLVQQRLAPIQGYIEQQQQLQQQQQQQMYQANQQEINHFLQTHEFANDVSAEMANFMQVATQTGQSMTLDQAYERAIALRPDIQQVIQQRMAAGNAKQNGNTVATKRQAAVSIAGGSPLQGGQPAPTSMRDQIAAAIEGRN